MKKNIIDILKKAGAITTGHFIGTSGRHMLTYINKDVVLANTKYTSLIGRMFADKFKNKGIDVVVAPAVGAVVLSQWTAYHLSRLKKKEILSIYTEKDKDKNQVLKRGFDKLIKGKKVLIIEDVTTVGSSVLKVIKTIKRAKGKIVAVSVMINRDPKTVNSKTMKVPFSALGVFKIPSYEEKNCSLCQAGIPVDTFLGHGSMLK